LNPLLSRDGPRELLCLLWPPSIRVRSRGGVARRGLPRALAHRLRRGTTPKRPHSSCDRPCSRTPPRRWKCPPHRWRNPCRNRTHVRSGITAGPVDRVAPMPGGSAGGSLRIAAPTPMGYTGISLVPAGNPCCCRTSSSRPFAGCLDRPLRRASTPRRLPSLRRIGATRSARSARVVRFPPRRLSLRAGFQALAPGTGPDSAAFPLRAPADRRWFPSCARGGRRVAFPQRCLTPLEEPTSRLLAHSGREPRTRRTASPRPLPPCRFHDFEALLGFFRPARRGPSLPTFLTHLVLPWALFPFEVVRLCRLREPVADFTAGANSADDPTACAASVRSRRLLPVAR